MASLQEVLERANSKFGRGEYESAYSDYLSAVLEVSTEDAENSAAVHTNAGACLLNMSRTEEALEEYEIALKFDCNNLNAWHNKGENIAL
jgi:tetratricopeptide (TPR) repeat protein